MMAEPQKIHPVDVEAPPPSAPLVPQGYSKSDHGDPDPYRTPIIRRTIPVAPPLRAPKRRRNHCYRCFCCTLCTLILILVILAAAAGVLYLVFHPKLPKYSVDRLRVTAFSIDANYTAQTSFDVTVTARNPNKKIGIYYEPGSDLTASYEDNSLCSGSFPRFYQGHRNTTVLTVVLTGETQLGSGLVGALNQQEKTGSVPLRFRADVPVKVKLGGLKLWKMKFGVRCDLVVDSLSASSVISLRTSSCKLKKLKLF